MPKRTRASSKGRKGFKRKFTRKFKRRTSVMASASVRNTTPSVIHNKLSRISRQALPDRFFTWVTVTNAGNWPSLMGVNTNSFAIAIDQIVDPFNLGTSSGVGKNLPNPITALNADSGSGVKNLLYNTTTNTGCYQFFRVWRVNLRVTVVPQASPDASMVAMAPLRGTASSYTAITALAQAPNSCTKTVTNGPSGAGDSIIASWSLPDLYGVNSNGYNSLSGSSALAYNSAANWYAQIGYNTVTGAIPTQPLQIQLDMQQFVEFFQRADTALLTS